MVRPQSLGKDGLMFSAKSLENLRNYKPHGAVDNSILLSTVLSHFYNIVAAFIPLSIAPNVVTLVGTISILIVNFLMFWYSPNFDTELPSWLCFAAAASIFTYQTLDNCDGKHAKRTGEGSPLGHLFDHGCDALACTIVGLMICGVFQLGFSFQTLLVLLFGGYLQAYFATWEELHTGAMTLGYINGPIEGLVMMQILCIISGLYGIQFWKRAACSVFWPTSSVCPFPDATIIEALIALAIFGTFVICSFHIKHGIAYCRRKNQSIAAALFKLVPLALLTSSPFFCLFFSPTQAVSRHGFLFFWSLGLSFAYFITRMMISHLSQDSFQPVDPLLLPWLFLLANTSLASLSPSLAIDEGIFLRGLFFVCLSLYSRLILFTVSDFRTHLGIPCLSLRHKKNKK